MGLETKYETISKILKVSLPLAFVCCASVSWAEDEDIRARQAWTDRQERAISNTPESDSKIEIKDRDDSGMVSYAGIDAKKSGQQPNLSGSPLASAVRAAVSSSDVSAMVDDLEVEVDGQNVILRGMAENDAVRRIIQRYAFEAGAKSVNSYLQISPKR